MFYLNVVLDFNFLQLHAQYVAEDALLRNSDGSICHLTNDAGMVNVTAYDFSTEPARRLWVDAVRNLTATGVVDGIYVDQAQVLPTHKGDGSGNWELCKKKYNTCCEITAQKAQDYISGRGQVMEEISDMLGPTGLLCAGAPASSLSSVVVHPKNGAKKPLVSDLA